MIATIDREALIDWYRRNRKRSAQLFALVEPHAYYTRPIPLRHPFAFYEGHFPAFNFLTLNERALGETPIDPQLEKLFERGIDPGSAQAAAKAERGDWPSHEAIQVFAEECDRRVEAALATADIVNDHVASLVRGEAAYTILEHEPMHHETLLYIIHQLDGASKLRIPQQQRDSTPPMNTLVDISAGRATLGADRDAQPFGWDNEFERTEVAVPSFSIDAFPVTNADYLNFANSGGPPPPFWIKRNGEWRLRAAFEELPLPKSWPVYVTHRMAEAYVEWKGMQLPSEAQYHRAAFGTPSGEERAFPWGTEAPEARFGNFNFERYDPEPVDAHPDGASAWGVYDLIGNGWEWTSTIFGPFDGFRPMASYPQYSADFFDGKHYVMKGASPVTAVELIRRSFRNWFFDDYPYMYAKFRCVSR
ncbi:MAG: SUMF1/EgtB/PvdO family nonheme iron enzyme [Candidatus Eremiobacteraeota bacterium]|nr:SUMF1/EgtB/PvdO family nonheme iron enzyme [Candidatus Eremiobacteraeota bacterium]